MLALNEFNEIVDRFFDQIVEAIDETGIDCDVELNQSILELTCADRSKIIINRHEPKQEIWVAARSSGHHFKYDGKVWIDTRSGETLTDALSRVLKEQTGAVILFD